ncbi:MAG: GNAT family N-acetyltransferase [Desulfobacula sp.]|nr:GNAT family N-acetyltransferase [Desulfobacula sp.]
MIRSAYNVIPLSQEHYAAYDEFVSKTDTSLFYASRAYKDFLESLLGCRSLYSLAIDNRQTIVGALPMMLSRPGPYGTVANSLPYYGSNGGVILGTCINEIERAAIRTALLDVCMTQLTQEKCASVTLITNPLYDDSNWYNGYFGGCLQDERIGQITLLPDSGDKGEQLLGRFEDPRPRNIRKAIKSGITWRISMSDADILFLRNTHQDNISAIGGIPKTEFFFSSLKKYFNTDQFRVFVAEHKGRPVAALLLLYFNRTVEYFTPVVVEEYRSFQPLSLLIFEAMKDAMQNGYRFWNWGGTWLAQKGLYKFKKKWGSTDLTYRYFTKVFHNGLLGASQKELLEQYSNFFVVPFKDLKR